MQVGVGQGTVVLPYGTDAVLKCCVADGSVAARRLENEVAVYDKLRQHPEVLGVVPQLRAHGSLHAYGMVRFPTGRSTANVWPAHCRTMSRDLAMHMFCNSRNGQISNRYLIDCRGIQISCQYLAVSKVRRCPVTNLNE